MSIGIALASDYEQVSDMLRDAETAMHQARGKARYEVFGHDMHGELMSRLKMETDSRRACERDELFVDYQPIARSRTLIGFEALVRWRHPEFGLVPPKDFIPVAEETGQILTIGQTVLESACRQRASGSRPIRPRRRCSSASTYQSSNLISRVWSEHCEPARAVSTAAALFETRDHRISV